MGLGTVGLCGCGEGKDGILRQRGCSGLIEGGEDEGGCEQGEEIEKRREVLEKGGGTLG